MPPLAELFPRRAIDLAIFRILTAAAWLLVVDPRLAAHYALYPPDLCFPPSIWRHLISTFPVTAAAAWAAYALFIPSALASLLGWRTRPAIVLMLLSGGYILTVPQFYGRVNHFNHLVWFAMLLAASPCADALSLDSRRLARAGLAAPARAPLAYSVPLAAAAALVGIAYFFPGYWKLRLIGWSWAAPDAMVNLLRAKWCEFGPWAPWPRLDRYPRLCSAGGYLTILFELAFLPLALWRRTRTATLLFGILFHIGTLWFMRIHLWHLMVGYAAFIPWHALGAWPREALSPAAGGGGGRVRDAGRSLPSSPTAQPSAPIACLLLAAALILGNLHNGALARNWWPLGCYPTFAFHALPTIDTLRIRADFPDGSSRTLTEPMLGRASAPERAHGLAESILASPDQPRRLLALWTLWQRLDPSLASATRATFSVATISTDPDLEQRVLRERVLMVPP